MKLEVKRASGDSRRGDFWEKIAGASTAIHNIAKNNSRR